MQLVCWMWGDSIKVTQSEYLLVFDRLITTSVFSKFHFIPNQKVENELMFLAAA